MVGNLSNFTKIDILRCLLKIEKPVSRSELSKMLGLGEGTIRAILDVLKKNKLLESNKQGHFLSTKGNTIVKKIKNNVAMKEIDLVNLPKNKKKIALHIKNPKKTGKSYILRDEAVKNGADGALILSFDGKLKFHDLDYEQDFSEIEKKFDLSKNDVVIVAYADSYKLAEHGALAAATELNSELKGVMERFG
jgi:predicted transcriptional regulator